MNVTRQFRAVWKWLTPGWLQAGQGELVQYVQGLVKDAYAERCTQTAYLNYPSVCAADALDFHGRSRGLPRGTFEADDSYRARLVGWRYPKGHRVRGTAGALLDRFELALRGTQHVIVDARNRRTESGSYPTFTVSFQAVGTSVTSAAAISVAWPPHATGDLGILPVWSANQAVNTPAGWTLLGTAGVGAVRLTVFYRFALSAAEANAAVDDSGTATGGIIFTYRGQNFSIADFAVAASADVDSVNIVTPPQSALAGTGSETRKIAMYAAAGAAAASGYASSAVPAGWAERFDIGAVSGAIMAAADALMPVGGGADSEVSATLTIARRSVGAYLVLSTANHDTWNWDGAGASPRWARYWLVCRSIGTPWASFSNPAWLAAWGDANATLAGSGVTFGELDAVRKLASDRSLGWTPSGTEANTLVLYFGSDPFPEPGGNWTSWANRDSRYRYVSLHPSVS